MTIQVTNDVLPLQHSSLADQWKIKEDDEDFIKFRKNPCEDDDYTSSTISLSSKDSDDDSVVSTSSSTVEHVNRVSFCEELITMEWTRPYTEPQDVPMLYYSTEETNRFRLEYRLERRMLNSLDVEDSLIAVEDDASECVNSSVRLRKTSTFDSEQLNASSFCRTSTNSKTTAISRRSISRVVVLHNDKIASYSDSSLIDNCDVVADFFDTPEFWSGSITWW